MCAWVYWPEVAGLDGGLLGGQCEKGGEVWGVVGVGVGGTCEYFPLLIFWVFKMYLFSYSAPFDSSSDLHRLMLQLSSGTFNSVSSKVFGNLFPSHHVLLTQSHLSRRPCLWFPKKIKTRWSDPWTSPFHFSSSLVCQSLPIPMFPGLDDEAGLLFTRGSLWCHSLGLCLGFSPLGWIVSLSLRLTSHPHQSPQLSHPLVSMLSCSVGSDFLWPCGL